MPNEDIYKDILKQKVLPQKRFSLPGMLPVNAQTIAVLFQFPNSQFVTKSIFLQKRGTEEQDSKTSEKWRGMLALAHECTY